MDAVAAGAPEAAGAPSATAGPFRPRRRFAGRPAGAPDAAAAGSAAQSAVAPDAPGPTDDDAAAVSHAATPAEPGAATAAESPAAPSAEAPEPLPLLGRPRDPLAPVVEDERRLVEAARALAEGHGPLAIDAERASGYRYGQRAYLVQVRREGAGTWLVDPMACTDLSPIGEAVRDVEWVIHAATQDLQCLAEVGLSPTSLFDTELGARLAGLPRAGLGAVVEHYLGVRLAKEHSAVDWSTRPLPEPWLLYAALDVELLAELREAMAADLAAQGKEEWARQEFAHLVGFTGPAVRTDPWRRTSGLHRVRGRRPLAVVRELWQTRDDLARRRDVAPGRLLPDAVLLQVALAGPATGADLAAATSHRSIRRSQDVWLAAVARAQALPEKDLPAATLPSDAPPPPRTWADRDPVAHARLQDVRAGLTAFSEQRNVPLENLLTPDTLRRVVWSDLGDAGGDLEAAEEVAARALAARGARPWQVDIAAPLLAQAALAHRG